MMIELFCTFMVPSASGDVMMKPFSFSHSKEGRVKKKKKRLLSSALSNNRPMCLETYEEKVIGTDFGKNKSKRRLCFYMKVGIYFPCGIEEAKLVLVAERVSQGAGIQEWRDYSNRQLSQHTCGRKWSLKVSLIFSIPPIRRDWQLQCCLLCSMD